MMDDSFTTTALDRKKKRLERLMIALAILAILVLTVLQTRVIRLSGVPKAHGLLIFVLVNINLILVFFLVLLVLRNFYKIFFEERRVLGAQLRTKLVIAFVSLSLVPTCLLFFTGLQFITTRQEYWFDQRLKKPWKMPWLQTASCSIRPGVRRGRPWTKPWKTCGAVRRF
ncbi:MAG: hypothetical protein V1816_20020 [Pseudomonadota bacterium]